MDVSSAMPVATATSGPRRRTQKRALAAGSTMMPTAISVPSAWKPATRLITSRARKPTCATAPRPLTWRRKPGSRQSRISGRRIRNRVANVTPVMPQSSASAAPSSASTEPNSTCSRSTLLPRTETMSTPSESEIR